MLVLAIDTTLASCSAAVFDSARNHVLASEQQTMDKGHAEAIAPMVQRVLAVAGVAATDLDRIAVTTGPGTFTGQRIGLALAHGMGVALGCAVVGIDTLTATAAPLLDKEPDLLVLHQAGATGKFYAAHFINGTLHGALRFDTLADIAAASGGGGRAVIGTGTPTMLAHAPKFFRHVAGHDLPVAAHFAPLAARLPAAPGYPQPIYLREPDAKPSAGFQPDLIRLAQATDIEALSTLHGLCFAEGWSADSLASSLSLPGVFALLAERDGRLRAFLLVQEVAGEAEVLTLCTEPRWRRRALAEKLLAAARDILRQHGVGKWHLEVAADNAAAAALYGKLGFVATGRRKNYYARNGGNAVDALLMSLTP